jgi:hypothetical protein
MVEILVGVAINLPCHPLSLIATAAVQIIFAARDNSSE